nr:hypothetical protein [Lachnospiraceae bacterium]
MAQAEKWRRRHFLTDRSFRSSPRQNKSGSPDHQLCIFHLLDRFVYIIQEEAAACKQFIAKQYHLGTVLPGSV